MNLGRSGEVSRVLLRGVLAGGVATAAMTTAYAVERRTLRTGSLEPMDYDDGVVPG
jgi:hypothetical protein